MKRINGNSYQVTTSLPDEYKMMFILYEGQFYFSINEVGSWSVAPEDIIKMAEIVKSEVQKKENENVS